MSVGPFLEKSLITLHPLDKTNKFSELIIKIDGTKNTTSFSTAGVVIGSRFCTAKDDGANQVTIQLSEPLPNIPLIAPDTTTADCDVLVQVGSTTTQTIVYKTVKKSNTATGVNQAAVRLTLTIPMGLDVV